MSITKRCSWPLLSTSTRVARGDRAATAAPSATCWVSRVRCAVLWKMPRVPAASRARKPLRRSSARIWVTGLSPSWNSRMRVSAALPSWSRTMNHWAMPPFESPTISEMPPSSEVALEISVSPSRARL
ncbi:hypothetical protein D3C81_1300440 [compost metagenome]